jgi:hypothetical protein
MLRRAPRQPLPLARRELRVRARKVGERDPAAPSEQEERQVAEAPSDPQCGRQRQATERRRRDVRG